MHDKKKKLPHAKSYTGISVIFGSSPFNNILYRNPKKRKNKQAGETTTESDIKPKLKTVLVMNETPYVTCEKYHGLNKNLSYNSMVRSTSTIFCDLDDIVKRHSFHCLTEVSISNTNILKVTKQPTYRNGFKGKSNMIVQECATQIHPKLFAKDSMETNAKKLRKKFPKNDVFSSEKLNTKKYYDIDISNYLQKFWSYGKYHTEYTTPIPEVKTSRKKERDKRAENPCPCQLFSYTCPCANGKSLTELARRNQNLTVDNQITSTATISVDGKKKMHDVVRENKFTNTKLSEKPEIMKPLYENIIQVAEKKRIPFLTDIIHGRKNTPKGKKKLKRKTHKMICPNCKERVEVFNHTSEEDNSLKCYDSFVSQECSKEMTPSRNGSAMLNPDRCQASNDIGRCNHTPRCDLVPICQILPTGNNSPSHKSCKNYASSPRIIRITKACRHHPPCTVVPSCQRANVLRNNCEYIPPCLHRPRCVNLPLCVPFSKNINYDEPSKQVANEENADHHDRKHKCIAVSQHTTMRNNVDRNSNTIACMQNTSGLRNGYLVSAHVIKQQSTLNSNKSPTRMLTTPCCSWRSNKSCQNKCSEIRPVSSHVTKGSLSTDAIILIRDVGCQFQNKTYFPKDSTIQCKTSSASLDLVDVKTGNCYTLRCEDKFTNPKGGLESVSTDSMSIEVDSQCPTHGRRSTRDRYKSFIPTQRYVTARASIIFQRQKDLSKLNVARYRASTFPVKSRRSFMKRKHSKMHNSNRRSNKSNLIVKKSKF